MPINIPIIIRNNIPIGANSIPACIPILKKIKTPSIIIVLTKTLKITPKNEDRINASRGKYIFTIYGFAFVNVFRGAFTLSVKICHKVVPIST